MSITTRGGDKGMTGLFSGERVPKSDPRPEAYGTVDEACSMLGAAKAQARAEKVRGVVRRIQDELFMVGAEVATEKSKAGRLKERIREENVAWLDGLVEELEREIQVPGDFIVPGETFSSALLDVARTVVRRAERGIVKLSQEGVIENPDLIRYMNRLSDIIYLLARYEEQKGGGRS